MNKGPVIRYTLYMTPRGKDRGRVYALAVPTYNPVTGKMRTSGCTNTEKTKEATADVRVNSMNHRPGKKFTGPVKVVMRVFRPWAPEFKDLVKNWGKDAAQEEKTQRSRPCAPKDSSLTQGPWNIKPPDNDNVEKLVFDALNGLFWLDDAQIIDNRTIKQYSDTPRYEIEITDLTGLTEAERGEIYGIQTGRQ